MASRCSVMRLRKLGHERDKNRLSAWWRNGHTGKYRCRNHTTKLDLRAVHIAGEYADGGGGVYTQ